MKKILLISYYWPPNAGVGARRWLNFQKYLSKEFSITVYTPENPSMFNEDNSLLNQVSSGTQVIKQKIWEPYDLYKRFTKKRKVNPGVLIDSTNGLKDKLTNWVRSNFFIPDAKCFWIENSISFLSKLFLKENYDFVISTGPPHSMHLIALKLREKHNFKWIADFRDPWTNMEYFSKIPLLDSSRRKHFDLEKKVISKADLTLTVSKFWSKEFSRLGAKKTELVYNGFEKYNSPIQFHDKFRIGYFGLFNELRDHDEIWKALRTNISRNTNFEKDLEIYFSGPTHNNFHKNLKHNHLDSYLNYCEWNNTEKMKEEMLKCSVLILSQANTEDAMGRLPAKFFEYLGTGIPIIAIGRKNSDLSKIILKMQCGVFFEFNKLHKLSSCFLNYYDKYLKKENNIKKNDVDVFSWENQASNLIEVLKKL